MRKNLAIAGAVLFAPMLWGGAPQAAILFSGSDDGASVNGPFPNSDAAQTAFEAAAAAFGALNTITYEAPLATGFYSPIAAAPGVSITLAAPNIGPGYSGITTNLPGEGIYANLFGFNTTPGGSQWLGFPEGSATFTFTTPTHSFGTFLTGLMAPPSYGNLEVTFNDGTAEVLPIAPNTNGGAQYYGFTDTTAISSITITNLTDDWWGVDDTTYNASCIGECTNTFNTLPSQRANSFSFVLKGDVRSQVDTAATATDPFVNAFAYVNQNFFGGSGTSSVSATLLNGNTVITYTGSHPILPSYKFDYNVGFATNDEPHFGFEGTPGTPLINISQFWNYGNDLTQTLPNLGVTCPAVTTSNVVHAVFYADVSFVNATDGGQWAECAFPDGTNLDPAFLFTNTTLLPEELSDVGFFLSDMAIPLDHLNFGLTPPPGQPGSPFTSLPQFDGLILEPGEGFSFTVNAPVPEPSTLALLGAGLGGLFACRWRTRRRLHPEDA